MNYQMNSQDKVSVSFLLRSCYLFMCKQKSKLEKDTKKLFTRNLFCSKFREALFAVFLENLTNKY